MDAGVVSGLLHVEYQGRLFLNRQPFALTSREQKASHRKRLRRRGAVCFVGAPLRCAPASPSSRLLASGPAALATPLTPFFSSLLVHGHARGRVSARAWSGSHVAVAARPQKPRPRGSPRRAQAHERK